MLRCHVTNAQPLGGFNFPTDSQGRIDMENKEKNEAIGK